MLHKILIVDDEKNTREGLEKALRSNFDIYLAATADEAIRLLERDTFSVVLTDLRMSGKSGLAVVDKCLSLPQAPVCIMMTAYGNVETAVEAMKRGAFDFLPKPIHIEKLEILIHRALKERSLTEENQQLHERLDEKYKLSGLVGKAPSFVKVLEQIKQVAPSKASVLITGETGTGKELIAQLLHQNSSRSKGPFVAVHCAALPSNLLESELFGHEKGAFTGATERRIGRFEAAQNGTLFLDEIGEIDANIQVKLLRFLETRSFERLGGHKPIPLDIRLLCATHKNLEQMVKEEKFREDLLYRLNSIELKLPPLRERKEDIPLLLNHYIQHFAKENKLSPFHLSQEAQMLVLDYTWPGNIRELRNFCENMLILHPGKLITPQQLDPKFLNASAKPLFASTSLGIKASAKIESQKYTLEEALLAAQGNKTKAAELMGISRRTLHRRLKTS